MESRFSANQEMEIENDPSKQNENIKNFNAYLLKISWLFHEIAITQQKFLFSKYLKQEDNDTTPIEPSEEQQDIFNFLEVIEQLNADPDQQSISRYLDAFNLIQKNSLVDHETRKLLFDFYDFMSRNLLEFPSNPELTPTMITPVAEELSEEFVFNTDVQMTLESYYKDYKDKSDIEDDQMQEMMESISLTEEPQKLVQLMSQFHIYAKNDRPNIPDENDDLKEKEVSLFKRIT